MDIRPHPRQISRRTSSSKEIPPFLIVTVFSCDLVKRSWFLYPNHSHCNGSFFTPPALSVGTNWTPHLFLEPCADAGTDGKQNPCPARCGWGCLWHCLVLIASIQEMLVGKGDILLLQDIKDPITPKGTGATLPERSNHSGRA